MKCILHIGTEKTGTSSFQAHMAANRAGLAKIGVLYPRCLGLMNHRALSVAGADPAANNQFFRGLGLASVMDQATFLTRLATELRIELDFSPDAQVCLISTEHLHSRLETAEQVQRLRGFLTPFFDDVTVYLHLRPQVEMMVSLASTRTRNGNAVTPKFFKSVKSDVPYYNYLHLVRIWQAAFGPSALRLVGFRREPDFAARLFADLGLDLTALGPMARMNEALDVRVMAMMNALVAERGLTQLPPAFLDALPVTQPLRLSRTLAKQIQKRFAASNAELLALRPDLQASDLVPDWQTYPLTGNEDALAQKSAFGGPLAALALAYLAAVGFKPDAASKKRN